MVTSSDFARLQKDQHKHDLRNHFDILSLHKTDRMKHYGLHFAKYVGRVWRDEAETKSFERTITDCFLVNLSAANTLMQDLSQIEFHTGAEQSNRDPRGSLAEAVGRFADACEKIDHMEEFVSMAKTANKDITQWIVSTCVGRDLDIDKLVIERRSELAKRHFYIED